MGGKDAGRWTASDPFRPDKFGNCVAIFVRHFYQIIHVSHSRSRERQPKPLAASRGFTEDPRKDRNIGRASRRFPSSASTLLRSQSLINELVSKFLANFVSQRVRLQLQTSPRTASCRSGRKVTPPIPRHTDGRRFTLSRCDLMPRANALDRSPLPRYRPPPAPPCTLPTSLCVLEHLVERGPASRVSALVSALGWISRPSPCRVWREWLRGPLKIHPSRIHPQL